jgi:eukaryotic-like serine/threonine-protein kinase
MSSLREIKTDKDSLENLQVGDALSLPRRSYLITGLASGGMGTVIFAELDRFKENAAISALPNPIALKYSHDPDRFVATELRKWALMEHERINPLCEILASESNGLVAASEKWSGSVKGLLARHGRLSDRCAYNVVRSCAEGLEFAERAHGILHLDIKPDNILFNESGTSREEFSFCLTDWGISSERTRGSSDRTEHTSQLSPNNAGTLPYMAPERLLPRTEASPQSDIYGLGITWLELLTGHLPYIPGKSLVDQIFGGAYFERAESMLRNCGVSRRVAKTIRRSIHPDPVGRIHSWDEFLVEIRPGFLRRLFS